MEFFKKPNSQKPTMVVVGGEGGGRYWSKEDIGLTTSGYKINKFGGSDYSLAITASNAALPT